MSHPPSYGFDNPPPPPPGGGPVYPPGYTPYPSAPESPKKKKAWPWVVGGIGLVLVLGCVGFFAFIVNAADDTSKSFHKITQSPGQAKDVTAVNVTKIGQVATVKYNGGEATTQVTEVKQVGTSVVVNVIFTGVKGQVPYNPMYFKWRNSTGTEANDGLMTDQTPLQAGTVLPGAKAQGHLMFANSTLDGGQLHQTSALLDTIVTWVP